MFYFRGCRGNPAERGTGPLYIHVLTRSAKMFDMAGNALIKARHCVVVLSHCVEY